MPGTAGPLLDEIRSAAAAAAADKVAVAHVDADAIRAAARDGAARRRASKVARHDRDAATALSRTRSEAAARVGQQTLAARAAALDRIFAEAERMFASLAPHAGLGPLLTAALADALTYLPEGTATVRCPEVIAEQLRAALAAAGRKDVEVRADDAVPTGMIIEAGDGSVRVDATFARRLARERPRLSTVVAHRLTEGKT